MKTLLDTDVISQATKPTGNASVLDWLARQEDGSLFLSVLTLAEIREGIGRMPNGKRRDRLEAWLMLKLPDRFEGCLLGIDAATADRAGSLMATCRKAGRNVKWMDMLIAATALTHGMHLATLNLKDFENLGLSLVPF